ncbi:AEC family transporter [Vibrio sp. SS-MA-C1-2]|uniref:AEC family transporter n=1 Tax=Vibrio sp. SS-MA-C1-2 TaxID=2908646 RepID=UPI001F1AF61C|nr:AEC family transporter [Vibrio sp. SS-MA-C1-2]UJF17855.1 AEC family transporter [Vibrio sp. SS-MA-C1-2]
MTVFNILLPLMLAVGLGYIAIKKQFFTVSFHKELSRFVLYIAMPAVIFNNVSQLKLDSAINLNFLLIYALSGLSCILIALLIARRLLKTSWKDAYINALGSGMPNSAFIGFPIALSVVNDVYIQAFIMAVIVENLLFIPLCLILLESVSGTKTSLFNQINIIIKKLIKNPLIVTIIFSITINLLGIQLPLAIQETLSLLSKSAIALALFVIGGALANSPKFDQKRRVFSVISVKLLLFPLIALLLTQYIYLEQNLQYALIIFCAAPMLTIYPVLGANYGQEKFCANTLITATLCSGITLSVVVFLLSSPL